MPVIDKDQILVTLITVHVCEPGNQQKLADLLVEAVGTLYRHLPGFISASIHKSHDGTRVTNYAQWRSREDFEAVRSNSDVPKHASLVAGLVSSYDAHIYDVIETFY